MLRISPRKKCSRRRAVGEIDAHLGAQVRHDHEIPAGAERRIEDRAEGRLHQIGMGPADALLLAGAELARREALAAHMARDVAGPNKNQLLTQHVIPSLARHGHFPRALAMTVARSRILRSLGFELSPHRRREPAFLEHGVHHSAEWLYAQASHCVLAHNTDPDPRFIYANRAAQAAFDYDWDEIMPAVAALGGAGRPRGASAPARSGRPPRLRHRLSGLRIAKSGRRFLIEDGVVWQLIDSDGAVRGQAATFAHWRDA